MGRAKLNPEWMAITRELLDKGEPYAKIRQTIKEGTGVDVSKSNLDRWRSKAHIPPRRPGVRRGGIPWRLAKPHQRAKEVTYLRRVLAMRAGTPWRESNPYVNASAWNWAKRLKREGKVLKYNKVTGFTLVRAHGECRDLTCNCE